MCFVYLAQMCVSDVVRGIKSTTGLLLKRRLEYMRKTYWGTDSVWSDGYFVSTVGVNEQTIKKYIEQRRKEDMGRAPCVLGLKST
ncbi:MAG: transposase [Rickettsiaceae bacterium]